MSGLSLVTTGQSEASFIDKMYYKASDNSVYLLSAVHVIVLIPNASST